MLLKKSYPQRIESRYNYLDARSKPAWDKVSDMESYVDRYATNHMAHQRKMTNQFTVGTVGG